jgi:hypothetical protein
MMINKGLDMCIYKKLKEMLNGDKASKVTFILASLSVLIFTFFILGSFFFTEKPNIGPDGFVIPRPYCENLVYFPCSGDDFGKSLANYIKINKLDICGMASRNSLWTKGYIVGVKPKLKCLMDGKMVYFTLPDTKY